jgi:Asp-tRNA(Asn)/Glu-tRNA(Gln) amidotransferase A subunit family amidase
MPELCDLGAVELRAMIGAKEISPVELIDSCLERIERVNPVLNAIVALDTAAAAAAAREAERAVLRGEPLGALHGLPLGIKDVSETAGLRTTFGSLLFKDHVPACDDAVVARLRASGGIVLGKTNTPEFGVGANTRNLLHGATGNPFDPSLTCAGSSGGSAAALAAGMVPLATGSDVGGSLRIPAAFCGILGFRPSPGLVATDRRLLGWSPLLVEGPMARSVADLALLLSAMAGDDPADPLSGPVDGQQLATIPEVDLAQVRVAVSEDLGFAPVSRSVRTLFRTRIAAFADLFRESVERDPELGDADRIFAVLRAESFLAAQKPLYDRAKEQLAPPVCANVEQALTFSYEDRALAALEQTRLYRRFQKLFDTVDVLICPAASVSPFPHAIWAPETIDGVALEHYYHWIANNYGLTLTCHPVVALPCGVDEQGLPFGLQIVGPRRGDRFVLGVAAALERAFQARPALARPIADPARLALP